ncbi:sugar ABC transporter substrate-binding protein (plasmid) [Deinococcus sp. KNUC1210]|uniref:ABC transporter substrate-binding protein n=1 Tax=Deinococcus sp. KNUC1210 TaxID=2917691 RepID=UPI001EF1595F|nr:sugar ABC transporter substrate-binding protein [Deinococcus sp. KNUC1210]ULH17728.1 sugar ABC transporter substrate-binding protein [Deinococcus sp. KNUC1210]
MQKAGKSVKQRVGLSLGLLGVLTLGGVVPSSGSAQGSMPYGLKAGKPYNGTKLKFLICCLGAGQFAQLSKLTGEGGEFNQLTGISVQWENTPYEALQQKELVEATTGSTYDAVAWVDAWGEAIKPYLVSLNDRIKTDHINLRDYPSAYVQAATDSSGNIIGMPFRGHPLVLFYRKDIFTNLRLPVPRTWQQVETTAQLIQKRMPGTVGLSAMYGVNAGQNLFNWVSMLWGNGGDILDKGGHPIFNNEKGLQATQFYIDLLRKDKVVPAASTTFGEPESSSQILQGKAAMWVGWWWYWSKFSDPKQVSASVLNNVGFSPAPGWAGGTTQNYGLVWPVGIFKNSKNQDAAWEFIKYVSNTDVQKKVASNRSDPALADNTIVTFSGMNDPKVNAANGGIPKVGGQALRSARTLPQVRSWAEIQSVLEIGINKMSTGADVKATLDGMARDVDAIQKRAGYYK